MHFRQLGTRQLTTITAVALEPATYAGALVRLAVRPRPTRQARDDVILLLLRRPVTGCSHLVLATAAAAAATATAGSHAAQQALMELKGPQAA